MGGKDGRAVVVVMIVMLGMVAGQSTASFNSCYGKCFLFCVIRPHHTVLSCSFECLKDCIIPSSSDTLSYCNLGCSYSLCTNISTQQNPGGEEMEGCVNSCSEMCTKHY